MWRLYRQDHRLSGDGLSDIAVEHVATDKRVLYHTLSRADLDAGLRQLPEALRAALILTTMEGYSLEDLTAIFGWSKPQTQIVLATARQLLDRFLQARLTIDWGIACTGGKGCAVTCDEAREQFEDLLHDRLSPTESQSLRQHLSECPRCLEELDAAGLIATLIRHRASYHRAPDHLRQSILHEVRRQQTLMRSTAPGAAYPVDDASGALCDDGDPRAGAGAPPLSPVDGAGS